MSEILTAEEIAKLRWAAYHPEVKIDEFDYVGDSLCERGYLTSFNAGYVDWYGYWARISEKGLEALRAALTHPDREGKGGER